MSQAHKGSRLSNISQVRSADKDTIFLAHYDITENDILSGITPTVSVSALRETEGKFGGGIAIEEATQNIIKDGNFREYRTVTYPWDSSLNGNLGSDIWSTANSGVPSSNIGYHAHINIDRFGYPVVEYIDRNGQFGHKHRWMGISQKFANNAGTELGWGDGTKVSVSFDLMVDHPDKTFQFGIHHFNSGGASTFGTAYASDIGCTRAWEWQRITRTFTLSKADWDFSSWARLYIYGYFGRNDYEGAGWVKNVQVETKPFCTSFVTDSRPAGKLSYPLTSYRTISGWMKVAPENVKGGWQRIVGSLKTAGVYPQWYLSFNATEMNFRVRNGEKDNAAVFKRSEINYADGKFHFFAIVFDKENDKLGLMIDGIYKELPYTGVPVDFSIHETLDVGWSRTSSPGGELNGILDEIRVDAVARSEEELRQWYLSSAPFFPKGIYRVTV